MCEMDGLFIRIEQISRACLLFKTQSKCLILLIYFHIQRTKRKLNYLLWNFSEKCVQKYLCIIDDVFSASHISSRNIAKTKEKYQKSKWYY